MNFIEDAIFPLGSDSLRKECKHSLKNKFQRLKTTFLPIKLQPSIIQAAMWHVSYHTTYCNALNMWIAGGQTAEEVQLVFYGADIPDKYRSEVLNAYLIQIEAMTEENKKDERETVF